jgi:hypothetical protein
MLKFLNRELAIIPLLNRRLMIDAIALESGRLLYRYERRAIIKIIKMRVQRRNEGALTLR